MAESSLQLSIRCGEPDDLPPVLALLQSAGCVTARPEAVGALYFPIGSL